MSTFRLLDIAQHLASRERARRLREEVVATIERTGQKVAIDLTDVLSVSDSFADELFGVLAQTRGDRWFQKHIAVTGASAVVRSSIVRAIRARLDRDSPRVRTSGAQGFTLAPPPDHLA